MTRQVVILANPIAGGGRGRRTAPELVRHLEARGIAASLRFTAHAGDAREQARALDPDRCWAVVVLGGDGTVNEVLNGLREPAPRLAVMPLGTANVLATELGLPRDPLRTAELVDRGRELRAAIGLAGGRRFLLFAGFGLDGRMVARLEQVRRGTLGKHKWLAPVLHVVRRWPRDRLRVTTAEGHTVEGCSEVLITRVRCYGGVFRMPEGIDIEDRRLHVLCFRQRTRWQYLRTAFRAWRGTLRVGRDLEMLQTAAAHVEADEPVPCQVDGDLGGTAPMDVTLAPEPARILVPPL